MFYAVKTKKLLSFGMAIKRPFLTYFLLTLYHGQKALCNDKGQPFKKVFDLQKCMKCVLSKGLSLRQGINIPVFVKLRGLNGGRVL